VDLSEPAILLDACRVGVMLQAWRNGLPPDHADRPRATLRLAQLWRAFDPPRARALAEEALAQGVDAGEVAATVVAAHLEEGAADAAALALAEATGPAVPLLRARLAMLRKDVDQGLALLDAILDDEAAPVEVRAEALSFRARAIPARGVEAALEDLAALEALAQAHQAWMTAAWVGTLRAFLASPQRQEAAKVLAAKELAELLRPLSGGPPPNPPLGPVPLAVHRSMSVHRAEPGRIPEILIPAAALLWRLGSRDEAFRTVSYGARIGHRLYGAEVSEPLRAFAAILARHAGPEEWAALGARLAADEQAFLARRSP
jgi:hypothetical protein